MKTIFTLLLLVLAPSLFGQNQSYLYSVEQSANVIEGFAINPTTGAVVAVPGSPFIDAGSPVEAATNSAGTFLFVANQNGNSISVFSIDTSGLLTQVTGSPFITGDGQQPSALAVSAD
jgi:6-phosphogluconolactonase